MPEQTLLVLEATGSYWVALAVTLHEAGYAVAVLNPAQLHNYAQSLPRRGKTDALDAQVFLRFAAERKPTPWEPPPAVYDELRQRQVARDGLLSMRRQARNQRHALQQWPVMVASVLTQLDGVIADLNQRLASLVPSGRRRNCRGAGGWCLGIVGRTAEHDPWNWPGDERLAAGEHAELQPVCEAGASSGLRRLSAAAEGVGLECA